MSIFITSVSGSESLASFINRVFHLSRPPGFRRAFDAAAFSAREQQQRKEKETSIPLLKDSESQCRRQTHPSELYEN